MKTGQRFMTSSPRRIFPRLIALALLLVTAATRATEPLPDGLVWFNRGTSEFNAGAFAAAATSFRRVIELRSPLAPAASLYLAKCHRREKHWNAALAQLGSLDDKDENLAAGLADERRRLAEAMSGAGTARLESGAAEEALALYDLTLRVAPDEDATYGRALALTRLGRGAEAAEALRGYQRDFPTGRYLLDARSFGEQLAVRGRRRPLWLQLEGGAGYDSNVFLTAIANTPVSAAAVRLGVDAGVRLVDDGQGLFLRAGFRGSWLEHVDQLSGRYVSSVLRGQVGYTDESWLLRASPAVSYQTVGTDPYLLQGSVTLDVQHFWDAVGLGVQYEGSRGFAQSATYSYVDGYSHWGDVHVDWSGPRLQLRALYTLGFDDIQDLSSGGTVLPLANLAHGPGAKAYWSSDGWEATVSATFLFRNYLRRARPDGIFRDDEQFIASVRGAKWVSSEVALFVSGSLLWNRSTLGATSSVSNRNYTQLITLLGVTWNALE